MTPITRREFTAQALAGLGATILATGAASQTQSRARLPTVRWGRYEISRILVGHNPIKGVSHFSRDLDRQMRDYFQDLSHGKSLLRRSQEVGINTCQMGSVDIETLLRGHYAEGGKLQWIATFYSPPGKGKDELRRILSMDPKPIGAQHYGGTTDRLMREGKIDQARDTLKMLRDAGLMVGLCTHNHEVIDYVENRGWDLDFYQGAFYRSCDSLNRGAKRGEVFEEEARQSMAKTLGHVSRPCIAFKVLGANRHCNTAADVEAALRFAFTHLKPVDVVLLGMWQKHTDQVGENAATVRKILGVV